MARMRDRIFAGLGAVLFFGSACALSVAVVMDQGAGDNVDLTSQQACVSSQSEETLAVPEVYKPEGAVAELQSTDLTEGTGDAAKSGDCLLVKYYGTLASDGTMFDENFSDKSAYGVTLGQGEVIKGWDQGLVGMKAGGLRRLVIPAALAYGDQANGQIPANSDLVFVVKLIKIQK